MTSVPPHPPNPAPGSGPTSSPDSGRRAVLAVLTTLLLVLAFAGPATAWTPTGDTTGPSPAATSGGVTAPEQNATNTTAPDSSGAQLSGAIAAEGAGLGGEIRAKRLEIRLERAATPAERAAILAEMLAELQMEAGTLEHRHETLNAARRGGDIAPGAFRHHAATLTGDASVLATLSNRSFETAAELPERDRVDHGVELQTLGDFANRTADLEGDALRSFNVSAPPDSDYEMIVVHSDSNTTHAPYAPPS